MKRKIAWYDADIVGLQEQLKEWGSRKEAKIFELVYILENILFYNTLLQFLH